MAAQPDRIGDYEVVRVLGHGGQATVYLCRAARSRRAYAVKLLDRSDAQLAQRLEREIEILSGLEHPNIVDVRDVGLYESRPYFVMRCYRGGTLRAVLERDQRLSVGATVGVVAALADALGSAHQRGVVHRDVKPTNVLLDRDGNPYLADFGVAAIAGGEALTRTGDIVGTAGYLSPERWFGAPLGTASDAFALGCVAFECLAGALPYDSFESSRSGTHADLAVLRPDVPVELAAAIDRLLDPEPSARPADLREWAVEIRAIARPERVVPAEAIDLPPDLNPSSESAGVTIVPGAYGARDVAGGSSPDATLLPFPTADTTAVEEPRRKRAGVLVVAGLLAAAVTIGGALALTSGGQSKSGAEVGNTTTTGGRAATGSARRTPTTRAGHSTSSTPATTALGGTGTTTPYRGGLTGTTVGTDGGGVVPFHPPNGPGGATRATTTTATTATPVQLFSALMDARSNPYLVNGTYSCGAPQLGVPAPGISVAGRHVLTVGATGAIFFGKNPPFNYSNGPDGISDPYPGRNGDGNYLGATTNIDPTNGFSGIYADRVGFLVGVFAGPGGQGATWVGNESASSFSPTLNQVFFIGDGLTGTGGGARQQFVVPAGATQLYIGVADGTRATGCPGFYDGNTGSFTVTIDAVS